jgi:hypothetical protein
MNIILSLCFRISAAIQLMALALYLMATCAIAVIRIKIRATVYLTNENTELATIVRVKDTAFKVI